jgi:hypothetical protein
MMMEIICYFSKKQENKNDFIKCFLKKLKKNAPFTFN